MRKTIMFGAGIALFAGGVFTGNFFLYLAAYLVIGGEVVLNAVRNAAKGEVFDENFLMTIASAGAFAIGEYPEAAAVMLFYQIGEMFQEHAIETSRKSIADLMDIRPDYANLKVGAVSQKVSPEIVNAGDIIIVKPGEKIPLDGEVIGGESSVDTSALTGESAPRTVRAGDGVMSGCVNKSGLLTVEVTKAFGESTAAKILDLVENASEKKAPTENFITTFAKFYTPAVVAFAALLAVIPSLITGEWPVWINRGLVFLVISCPCALVVSIPLGFFGGIGGASRRGILVKGGNYLEALAKADTFVFDKTGTLTKGVFKVAGVIPANGFGADKLIETAAFAERYSNHPIAKSIAEAYGKPIPENDFSEFEEIAGLGVKAGNILAGNAKLMEKYGIAFTETDAAGTVVYVAEDGVFAGSIVIADEVKPEAKAVVSALKTVGIRTFMLTGDDPKIAEYVGSELGIGEVRGGLLPADKVACLEEIMKSGKGKTVFVGDGINDAPVLTRADIGIAMGALGSDAAIEAADIVIMNDNLMKIPEAIDVARMTRRVVKQNIGLVFEVKAAVMLLGAIGIASMWAAVFADVGVALIAIMNAVRIVGMKR